MNSEYITYSIEKRCFFLEEAFKRLCAKQALAYWIITETTSVGVQEYNTMFVISQNLIKCYRFSHFTKDKILKEWVYLKVNQVETQKTFISYVLDTEDVDKQICNLLKVKENANFKYKKFLQRRKTRFLYLNETNKLPSEKCAMQLVYKCLSPFTISL